MSYPVYYAVSGDTIPHLFNTFDSNDPSASVTLTGLAVTDIEIYKDGGVTQRSSDAGYTLLDTDGIDFDGVTGIHGFSIDTSDNTDAGFYEVGPWYHVVVASVTIDAATVNFVAFAFRLLDATRGMAGTALPDAAADAAGGLPISDAGGLDMDAILVDTNSLNDTKVPDTISLANINAEVDTALTDYDAVIPADLNDPTAAAIADAVWDELQSAHVTVGSFGEIATEIASILADTNELQTDDVPGLIAALNDPTAAAIADAVWDELQADHTTVATFGILASEIATILTNADAPVSTVDTVVDAIKVVTDALPDGGALTTLQADTDDIQTRLPAALVGGKMDSDMTAISGDTTAADRLEALMDGVIIAQVNDASATTTAFAADGFTEATDDHFNGRLITFITGALAGQQTDITDYDAAGHTQGSQTLVVTALTEAPANNDFFVIH